VRQRDSQSFSRAVGVSLLIALGVYFSQSSLCPVDLDQPKRVSAHTSFASRGERNAPYLLGLSQARPRASGEAAAESNDVAANAANVYEWLLHQQSVTGILGNQENESFSGLYPNALAALCYLHEGDIARAEMIFSFFDRHLDSVAKKPPGGFCQFWDATTGQPLLDSDRWIGDNAWLLIALNYHRHRTARDTFADMRQTIAEWLISLQDVDGGIRSGFNKDGLMWWKSTEGNLDSYAALIDYPLQRENVGNFLREQMWVPGEGRFRMGSTASESALDCLSWGVNALGSAYSDALLYAEAAFLCQHTSDATTRSVTGFCDFLGRDRIWLEGTGQMVVAYYMTGQTEKAQQFLGELDKAIMPSQRFWGTLGLACHTNNPAWATGSTTIFVPSQAWYLFGAWRFNPMPCVEYGYPDADLNDDGKVDIKDFCTLAEAWLQDKSLADVGPPPCGDNVVDSGDLVVLAENWLTGTKIPPLPSQAGNPSPPDGAGAVVLDAHLSWTAGSDAESHDVYFGTASPPQFQGNQTTTVYGPPVLSKGVTYYWRIDEINAWGKTTGQLWWFTAGTGPRPR